MGWFKKKFGLDSKSKMEPHASNSKEKSDEEKIVNTSRTSDGSRLALASKAETRADVMVAHTSTTSWADDDAMASEAWNLKIVAALV